MGNGTRHSCNAYCYSPRPSPLQPRAFIIKPCRLRARTVRVAHKLPVFVPLQVFISPARRLSAPRPCRSLIPCAGAAGHDRLQVAPLIILITHATPRHPPPFPAGATPDATASAQPAQRVIASPSGGRDGHRHSAICRPARPSSPAVTALHRSRWSSAPASSRYAVTGPCASPPVAARR